MNPIYANSNTPMLNKKTNYTEQTVTKWAELIRIEEKHRSNFEKQDKETEWIFRGIENSDYRLLTTLERDLANISGIKDPNTETNKLRKRLKKPLKGQSVNEIESGLLRKFKRQYHHYGTKSPEENNVIEWLALMRHYGAPSRLLDWTYSFYIAVFFALEQANSDCAVWALEKYSLKENREHKIPKEVWKILKDDEDVEDCKTWNKVFKNKKPIPLVYPVNPFKLNERIVTQQGDCLCPSDISKTFEENLAAVLSDKHKLYKYIIKWDPEERRDILLNLHRMNINRATLFPGLGGFAQSLKTLMVSPKNLIKPDSDCKEQKITRIKKKK